MTVSISCTSGARSFGGERTYKPKKLVAYRMRKGPSVWWWCFGGGGGGGGVM